MPTNIKACADDATKSSVPGMPDAYYQLHSLLHTIRALATHEDDLCTLLSHIQRTGKMSAAIQREAEQVLAALPVMSLEQEVRQLWSSLERAAA